MWNEHSNFLNSQLAPGESLLWSGSPRQGVFFRASDAYTIPFSLLWCGFAVFWNFGVWYSDAPIFFRIWGIPFLVVGAYMVIGRFFVDAWQRSKTYYGLTNERALITSGIFSRSVKSIYLKTLTEVSIVEKNDLSGTITFGPAETSKGFGSYWPSFNGNNQPVYPAFDSIPAAKSVYDRLMAAQRLM